MQKDKNYLIYLTINKTNGKFYIGQHFGYIEDKYIGSGSILKKAIKKYGTNAFVKILLEICYCKQEVNIKEIEWIQFFRTLDVSLYNITEGGTGGNTLINLSKDDISKRTAKYKNTIEKYTDKQKIRISKNKSRAAKKACKNKEYIRKRVLTFKETINNKERSLKIKQYEKISGSKHYCARRLQTPLGVFETATEAGLVHNVHIQTILNRCKNKNFADWKFLDE